MTYRADPLQALPQGRPQDLERRLLKHALSLLDLTEDSVAHLPCTITLSESTLDFLAGLLQVNWERLGTWRKLPARNQALLVLAPLRNGDTYERLAASFKIGVATVHRSVHEAVTLLARRVRGLIAAR